MPKPQIWINIPLSPTSASSPPPPTLSPIIPDPPENFVNFFVDKPSPINKNEHDKFNCPTCLKPFPTELGLKAHKLSHFRLNKAEKMKQGIQCLVCFKYFSTPNALKVHKRVHSGLKFYKCKFCDKEFTFENSLVHHIRTDHEKFKPFQCEECPMAFPISSNLKNHVKNVHSGNGIFGCPYCSATFKQAPRRSQHIKEFHLAESRVDSVTLTQGPGESIPMSTISSPSETETTKGVSNLQSPSQNESVAPASLDKMKGIHEANLPIKKRTHHQSYPSPEKQSQDPSLEKQSEDPVQDTRCKNKISGGKFIPVVPVPLDLDSADFRSNPSPNGFTHFQITNNAMCTNQENLESELQGVYDDLDIEFVEPAPKTASEIFKRKLFQADHSLKEQKLSSEEKKRIFELAHPEAKTDYSTADKKYEYDDVDDGADSFIITGSKFSGSSSSFQIEIGDTIIECLDEQPIADSVIREIEEMKYEYSKSKSEEDPESSYEFDVVEIDSKGQEILRPYISPQQQSSWNNENGINVKVKSEKLNYGAAFNTKKKGSSNVPNPQAARSRKKLQSNHIISKKFSSLKDSVARSSQTPTSSSQNRNLKSESYGSTEESFFEQALPITDSELGAFTNSNPDPEELESEEDDSSGIKILNTWSLASIAKEISTTKAQANDTRKTAKRIGATNSSTSKNILETGFHNSSNIWW